MGGRIRHGITTEAIPDDLATLSDLILLYRGDGPPQTFVSALPSMRTSTKLEADEQLVLGWEIFGLASVVIKTPIPKARAKTRTVRTKRKRMRRLSYPRDHDARNKEQS